MFRKTIDNIGDVDNSLYGKDPYGTCSNASVHTEGVSHSNIQIYSVAIQKVKILYHTGGWQRIS